MGNEYEIMLFHYGSKACRVAIALSILGTSVLGTSVMSSRMTSVNSFSEHVKAKDMKQSAWARCRKATFALGFCQTLLHGLTITAGEETPIQKLERKIEEGVNEQRQRHGDLAPLQRHTDHRSMYEIAHPYAIIIAEEEMRGLKHAGFQGVGGRGEQINVLVPGRSTDKGSAENAGVTAASSFSLDPPCSRGHIAHHTNKASKNGCSPEDVCGKICGAGVWLDADAAINEIADSLVKGWMRSPGHRATILTGTFTHTAVAVVEGRKHFTDKDGKDHNLPAFYANQVFG